MAKMFVVEYAGWFTVEPKDIMFVCSENDSVINGEEYLELDEDTQGNYYMESMVDTMQLADDGSIEQLDISTQEIK